MPIQDRDPRTVRGWVKQINQSGVSDRAVPQDGSDLLNPNYLDAERIKPERTALAGIIAIRAYQRARRLLLAEEEIFSSPRCKDLPEPQEEHIVNKAFILSDVFKEAMTICLIEDEKKVKANPQHPAYPIYQRLDEILEPVVAHSSRQKQEDTDKNSTPIFNHVMNGVIPLVFNSKSLLTTIYLDFYRKYERVPNTQEVEAIARSSYETFIMPNATLHSDDGLFLQSLDEYADIINDETRPVVLNDEDRIVDKPEVIEKLREYQKLRRQNRSQTTRCAFLIDPHTVEKFLDEPADFDDPLKDAFDLILNFTFA